MPVNLFSPLAYDNFLIFIVNPPDGISLKSKTDFEETLLRLISTLSTLPSGDVTRCAVAPVHKQTRQANNKVLFINQKCPSYRFGSLHGVFAGAAILPCHD